MGGNSTGFHALWISGDLVMQNPKECTTVFCTVVFVSMVLEWSFHRMKHNKSRFVRFMFVALSAEIMTVELITLIVIFMSGQVTVSERLHLLFEWCHFVLFFMMVFYILLNCLTVLVIRFANKQKMEWETTLPDVDDMRNAPPSGQPRHMYLARLIFKEQVRRIDDNGHYDHVPFTAYLERMGKANIVNLCELRWQTWLALGLIFLMNAIRQFIIPMNVKNPSLTDRIIDVSTFIVLLGYLPLAIFCYVVIMVSKGLNRFMNSIDTEDYVHSAEHVALFVDKMGDPTQYLIRGSKDVTLILLQIFSLAQQLYLSMFLMGEAYILFGELHFWAFILGPLAFIPIVVFQILMPWVMYTLAVLTALGPNLNVKLVENLAKNEKADMPMMDHHAEDQGGFEDHAAMAQARREKEEIRKAARQAQKAQHEEEMIGRSEADEQTLLQLLNVEVRKLAFEIDLQENTIDARDKSIKSLSSKLKRKQDNIFQKKNDRWQGSTSSLGGNAGRDRIYGDNYE